VFVDALHFNLRPMFRRISGSVDEPPTSEAFGRWGGGSGRLTLTSSTARATSRDYAFGYGLVGPVSGLRKRLNSLSNCLVSVRFQLQSSEPGAMCTAGRRVSQSSPTINSST
jgi:hypothetical protein